MKEAALLACAAAGLLFGAAALEFPPVGDPHAPAHLHVAPRYIAQGFQETGSPNLVTAVLADYRGFDTLGETTVIFTAGMACWLIFGGRPGFLGTRRRPARLGGSTRRRS